MLQYVPIYGSILLTIIIVWIVASTIVGNRRKIGQALDGAYIRSTCCGATTTPIGWTEEGWTSRCDACGEWQYLGDDHDNPPPGFQADGRPTRYASGGFVSDTKPHLVGERPSEQLRPEVTSEITLYPHDCTCHPDDRPAICQHLNAASDCQRAFLATQAEWYRDEYRKAHPEIVAAWDEADRLPYYPVRKSVAAARIAHALGDEGEPVVAPPLPNIGGEGHPKYDGPHYEVEHDRFVPYDMLADPIPGTAVHKVGDVAFAGPLPADDDKGKGDAEDDHRSS